MRRRVAVVAAAMAAIIAGYSATNRWHWRTPSLLPLTALDRGPLRPWAIVFYFSHFVFLPLALLAIRGEEAFARTWRAMLIAAGLSDVFFLLYPTTLPRAAAPDGLFALLNRLDAPTNCFPSQHVALACVAAWGLCADRRRWAPLGVAWAAAIAVSTVLVKQHYAADVAGGALLAALSAGLSPRAAADQAASPRAA